MLTIDPEFRSLIPPLSAEEREQLEANIVAEGRARVALVTWNGILLDGHNRFDICQKHGLPFTEEAMTFEDRDAAKIWIIREQFGRRNLTHFTRGELSLKLEPLLKAKGKSRQIAAGGDKVSEEARALFQHSGKAVDYPKNDTSHTDRELAKVAGVSHDTISKVRFIEKHAPDEMKEQLRAGERSIRSAYLELRPESRDEKEQEQQPIGQQSAVDERPKPAKENYRINVNRVNRASSICEEAWTMANKESFQVSIVELRSKLKLLREELSGLKTSLEKRERHAQTA